MKMKKLMNNANYRPSKLNQEALFIKNLICIELKNYTVFPSMFYLLYVFI